MVTKVELADILHEDYIFLDLLVCILGGGAKNQKSYSHSPWSTDSKNIKMSSEDPLEVLPQDWSLLGQKYKGNGPNFGYYFSWAIIFKFFTNYD